MGATFANIQVHAGEHDPLSLHDKIMDCLRAVLLVDGFLPAAADEAAERTIFVAVAPKWIGIYDELCDEQRQDVLEHLARELSERLAAPTVTILVHDSDVLELGLFGAGTLLDRFNNNPDYFGKVSAKERRSARGHPEHWSSVLTPGALPTTLRAVWRKQKLFAEDTLRETADLLGLAEERAQVGFRYLQEGDETLSSAQVSTLRFRRAVRPAQENAAEGTPRFEFHGSAARIVAVVGRSAQFHGSVRNRGGPWRGLSVVIFGDALDRGLLSVTSVQLVVRHGNQQTVLTAPSKDELRGERRRSVAHFPDLAIVAGPAMPESVVGLDTLESVVELAEAWKLQQSAMLIHANVFCLGGALGTGEVQLAFVPLGGREGAGVIRFAAEVFPPARRPLRAIESEHAVPQLPTHVLFTLVSLDLGRPEAAGVAASMIERFCGLLTPSSELAVTVVPRERARVKTSKASVSHLLRGARWQKLKGELERAACVGGERKVKVDDFHARRPSDGFSFGGALIRRELTGDRELPTLALWFDLENVPSERAVAAETLLEALMTEAMVSHSGMQAVLGRTTAMHVVGLDSTEYERACGIHGQCTVLRSWLTRFVRIVPVGTLWLGEPLATAIPDMKTLEASARVESLGRVLKITIENEAALERVERAVAPLLASEDDYVHARNRLCGR
jgi:hypothetical protein